MKKRFFRSLAAWAAGISLVLTALPVSAFALEDDSADIHAGPNWVMSEGEWYETGDLLIEPPSQIQNYSAQVSYDPSVKKLI